MENIISQKIQRTNGKDAWRQNLLLAIFAADKVRSSLGPKGAYKLVAYRRGPEHVVKVTKDSIAILDELAIQYPPATIISEAAKLQRQETGDGATGFVVLLSSLLKKADELLIMGFHANTIIHGFRLATEKALEIMEKQAVTFNSQNNDILDIVDCQRSLLTPHIRTMIRQAYPFAFSEGRFEQENIRFVKKKGGSLQDSNLIRGVVIKKEKSHPNMPDKMKNVRIAITSNRLGVNRLEIKMVGQGPAHIHLNIKTPQQINEFKDTEYRLKTQPVEKLSRLNVNVLLSEQPLDDFQKEKLLSQGIFGLENIDRKDTVAVSKATGAKILGNLTELTEQDIGFADQLSTSKIELEKTVTFEGCKGVTFLLRGSIPQTVDELETAIKNSLTILNLMGKEGKVLPGGGAAETHIAEELKSYSKGFASREQIVIDAYAAAIMDIPRCLAENYGLNTIDALLELRKRHSEGFCNFGVNAKSCIDMNCLEPLKVKRSAIRRAYEVSMLMLRIDELLISKEIPKFHKQ